MVCAGFLMLMISLGVVRVRAARRRAQQEETAADTEMAWDDSALTITVNPMEVYKMTSYSTFLTCVCCVITAMFIQAPRKLCLYKRELI